MKITNETELIYDYFSDTAITLNSRKCYYYEDHRFLDAYQLREIGTDMVLVCSEIKKELLDYLIDQNATIECGELEKTSIINDGIGNITAEEATKCLREAMKNYKGEQ